jgi:hypothetical protein
MDEDNLRLLCDVLSKENAQWVTTFANGGGLESLLKLATADLVPLSACSCLRQILSREHGCQLFFKVTCATALIT